MKVLIIDDDLDIASLYQTTLTRSSYQVTTAATGKDGLDKAKSEKPDFILLDQMLPDMQGNEVLKTLKADIETKDIPVAMLTNFSQDEMVQAAMNAGAVDYLMKYKIDPLELGEKIKSMLRETQSQKEANQSS